MAEKKNIKKMKAETARLRNLVANPYPPFEAPKDSVYLGGGMWKKKKKE